MDRRHFTDEKSGLYPHSSVQINVPDILANQIIQWGDDMINDGDIYSPPSDPIRGREEEMHVTVLYGIYSQTHEAIQSLMASQHSFEVKLGFISIFTSNLEFDVVKIEVSSPGLFYLNHLLKVNINNESCYPVYKPHVTIAYIKKGGCSDLVGRNYFKEWTWVANSVIFSSKNGQKTPIRLNTLKPVRCS